MSLGQEVVHKVWSMPPSSSSSFYFCTDPLLEFCTMRKIRLASFISLPQICSLAFLPVVSTWKLTSMDYTALAPWPSCLWLVLTKGRHWQKVCWVVDRSQEFITLDPRGYSGFTVGTVFKLTVLITILPSPSLSLRHGRLPPLLPVPEHCLLSCADSPSQASPLTPSTPLQRVSSFKPFQGNPWEDPLFPAVARTNLPHSISKISQVSNVIPYIFT